MYSYLTPNLGMHRRDIFIPYAHLLMHILARPNCHRRALNVRRPSTNPDAGILLWSLRSNHATLYECTVPLLSLNRPLGPVDTSGLKKLAPVPSPTACYVQPRLHVFFYLRVSLDSIPPMLVDLFASNWAFASIHFAARYPCVLF